MNMNAVCCKEVSYEECFHQDCKTGYKMASLPTNKDETIIVTSNDFKL